MPQLSWTKVTDWFQRNRWWLTIVAVALVLLTAVFLGLFVFDPHIFFHYVIEDLYKNMWSNMFAPSLFTVVAIFASYIRGKIHRERLHKEQIKQRAEQHEELKAAINGGIQNG